MDCEDHICFLLLLVYSEESIEALEHLTIFNSFWKDAERPEPHSYPSVAGQTIQFAGSLFGLGIQRCPCAEILSDACQARQQFSPLQFEEAKNKLSQLPPSVNWQAWFCLIICVRSLVLCSVLHEDNDAKPVPGLDAIQKPTLHQWVKERQGLLWNIT